MQQVNEFDPENFTPRVTPRRSMMRRTTTGGTTEPLSGTSRWLSVRQQETVYSYFKFIVPVEDRKFGGRLTYTKTLAYLLVFFSIALQFVLLYAIFDKVVNGDIKWQNKILNPQGEQFGEGGAGDSLMSMIGPAPAKCNKGGSLCFKLNGTVSCAPPTVQLTGRWEELDIDGDGVWTREEVEASKEELQCKYAVNPVEVFDVFQRFLLDREKVIWLHPDVRAGKAIPKAYFTYAAGDIIMCGYRSTDMCANVLKMGAFDAPLKYGTAPRVGETIDSALDYCYALLEQGGTCERTLPSTYSVWRKNGEEQCGAPDYDKFVYTHPKTSKSKSMLVVDYEARKDYDRAQSSTLFLVYKCIIIGLFLLVMFNELKDCLTFTNWCIKFPSASEFGEDEAVLVNTDEAGETTFTVQGITTCHRMTMAFLTVVRYFMLGILVWVGLSFLLKDTNYIDLLLNAVGFVFIVEISNYMYMYFLDPALRDEVESVEPMQVQNGGPRYLNKYPALRDMIGIFGLVSVVIIIIATHHSMVVKPLWQALECTCLGVGDGCMEAAKFTPEFWENYWRVEVPAVFDEVAEMKKAVESGTALVKVGHSEPRPVVQGMVWHLGGKQAKDDSHGDSVNFVSHMNEPIDDTTAQPRRHTRAGKHHSHHGGSWMLNGRDP